MRKQDGRSSGDAYAVFDTEEAAVEAMQYDKQKLGSRWVDLFQSNKGELYSLTSLGGIMLDETTAAPKTPLVALGDGYSVVKLRGLPWSVTVEDVGTFLNGITVPTGGVHLMNSVNGRPSGLAYVELNTEEDQAEALRRDKQSIGGRYIDVFACTQTELQARLAGGLERAGQGGMGHSSSADAHFVKLRGLPYQANEQQIAGFFQPLHVVAVQVAFNASAQPSGFGFVQFRTPDDATGALSRSNQVLGSRYVEVFRCARAEMEQARVHALSVTPYMRGHGIAANMQQGAGRANNGHSHGGRSPSDTAYAAYQAALQTLATRQSQSAYAAAGYAQGASGYAQHGGYADGNGGMTSTSGGYGQTYGQTDASVYGQGGYATGTSAGYGQVAGGYGPAASSAPGGYGTAPATAGYTPPGGSSSQSYYPPQGGGANGAAAGYAAADYAQYSNYYYSQTGTYH
jgi:heterogeneous nuclear ribonucleoprotein F/H